MLIILCSTASSRSMEQGVNVVIMLAGLAKLIEQTHSHRFCVLLGKAYAGTDAMMYQAYHIHMDKHVHQDKPFANGT